MVARAASTPRPPTALRRCSVHDAQNPQLPKRLQTNVSESQNPVAWCPLNQRLDDARSFGVIEWLKRGNMSLSWASQRVQIPEAYFSDQAYFVFLEATS